MSSSMADKLSVIAHSEMRVYQAGYDKGYEAGAAEGESVDRKTEVEGAFSITANGEHSFTPGKDEVFSSVKVNVNVPTDSGGVAEGTFDSSFVLTSSGATCYCPASAEGGSSYNMMAFDSMGNYIAFAKFGVVEGARYKVYCNPMGAPWESFIFGMSDYSSSAIPTDDAHVGQYVSQVDNNTYIVTIPPNCANLFINVSVLGGCVAFLI